MGLSRKFQKYSLDFDKNSPDVARPSEFRDRIGSVALGLVCVNLTAY